MTIPAGTRLVGEGWSVLAGKGSKFQNQYDPKVVFRVGEQGSTGITEITDVVFTTVGPTPGAIVVEWNVRQPDGIQAGTGMWDSHIRYVVAHLCDETSVLIKSLGLVEVRCDSIRCNASHQSLSVMPTATGTNLERNTCTKSGVNNFEPCYAAFMGLHITSSATGYFEVNCLRTEMLC